MRFTRPSPLATFIALLSFIACTASAERLLSSTSLSECIENSNFTAKLFNVAFTPDNNTITFDVDGTSTLTGNFTLVVEVAAYGYVILKTHINPCETKELLGLCTMQPGPMPFSTPYEVSPDVVKNIPFIAYTVPDLDATVKIQFESKTHPGVIEACVEAQLSNGKTVDQNGVSWGTAGVAGLALVVSAVIAGLGHSNTAAHIAAYALSLFSYFQAVAIVGMTSVPLPPIVQSWTQNFQWTMGVIGVEFMQNIASWYQKSTGGTPATILNTLTTTSVHVMRRSLTLATEANSIGVSVLKRAATNQNNANPITGTYTVRGIDRVAFRSSMESTNLFLTGLMFFCFFLAATTIGVVAFKGFCELAVKYKWMKSEKFEDFRLGWKIVLKGIMYRMVLIGYPQMTILCLWEFTKVDSPAEVTLAVIFFFGMTAILAWAASKVVLIGRRSKAMHKNPAYMLYSDPTSLNRWGFLYIQFRATAYYYIIPTLVYILIKGMFIALGQRSGTAQAIGLLIIEGGVLAAACVLKPWMDKSTNTVNISICSINVFNAICLIFYSDIFGQPALATGVIGVAFFVVNAAFAFVLLILVIVSTILAATRKNPDTRYQTMSDDRASFIKSQTALSTELDALGATARGEMKGGFKHGLDLDDDSWESESMRRHPANMALPPSTANSHDAPAFASDRGSGSPFDEKRGVYQGSFAAESRPNSDISLASGARMGPSPTPQFMGRNGARGSRTSLASQQGYVRANNASPLGTRDQNTPSSPWQRGAGYDH
ncbi:putative flavin carrier protein 3 [Pseudogymnoascus australis]